MLRESHPRFSLVVHTVLRKMDHVFLLQRQNTGFLDGYWTFPGGHVKIGEEIAAAAMRECIEEARVNIDVKAPALIMPYEEGVDFIFVVDRWDGEAHIGEPDKAAASGWFPESDLPDPTAPFIKEALRHVREKTNFAQYHP